MEVGWLCQWKENPRFRSTVTQKVPSDILALCFQDVIWHGSNCESEFCGNGKLRTPLACLIWHAVQPGLWVKLISSSLSEKQKYSIKILCCCRNSIACFSLKYTWRETTYLLCRLRKEGFRFKLILRSWVRFCLIRN